MNIRYRKDQENVKKKCWEDGVMQEILKYVPIDEIMIDIINKYYINSVYNKYIIYNIYIKVYSPDGVYKEFYIVS